jgi:hypothetical protein
MVTARGRPPNTCQAVNGRHVLMTARAHEQAGARPTTGRWCRARTGPSSRTTTRRRRTRWASAAPPARLRGGATEVPGVGLWQYYAKNLVGKLLLIHGEMDEVPLD